MVKLDNETQILHQAWDVGKTAVLVLVFTIMFVTIWNGIKIINNSNINRIVTQNESIKAQ